MKVERQAKIRRLVEEKRQVSVTELSMLLHVSEATIRRDLDTLDGAGLDRTHGGAVLREREALEPPVVQRLSDQFEAKRRIGQAAAAMVQEGETIFISSGSTTLELARALRSDMRLTVITNSLPVINHLAGCPNVELLVVGGMFRRGELSMVGHAADLVVREFRANRTFMGMRAIDPRFGFTNDYMPEVLTDRAIIEMASQIVVLADHTKFGRVFPVFVAPATAAQVIIADAQVQPEIAAQLRDMNIVVTIG